jgi:hypothetical protein
MKKDTKNNTGIDNTGENNSGDWNSGDRNSGDRNSGYRNSGYRNSGYRNSGYGNSGDRNSGDRNSGYRNSGYRNSGYGNSGDRNSGDRNSGDWNSGDWNSGDWNSGYGNSTDRESGIFCSELGKVRMFNKPTNLTWDEINHPRFGEFYLCNWIDESEMTEQEKIDDPEFYVRGGYLKTFTYQDAWANFWKDTDRENRQKFLDLPNFDSEVFKEITGIDVGNNSQKQELLNKADELIKKAEELKTEAEKL